MTDAKIPCYLYTPPQPGKAKIPLVIDAPHSGTYLPDDFDFICSLADLRQSDEPFVELFGSDATHWGAGFLQALVTRAYIDLNRPLTDLSQDLCAEPIPWPIARSRRVQYGIGLIRHLIRPNEPVYAEKLPLEAIEYRIEHYYEPYYKALEDSLNAAHAAFGKVLHLNLHGMPNIGADGASAPDIVLGDHDGHSSGRIFRDTLKRYFESCGLKVVINHPYKGVELTRRFARPRQGFHSLQVEVNKALFMDEGTFQAHEGLDEMRDIFNGLWQELAAMLDVSAMPHAAE